MSKDQLSLLATDTDMNNGCEWIGMPEFSQQDLTSFRKIVVHFRNKKDVVSTIIEIIGMEL